ncbi:hypothetical protein ACFOVU_11465 [Nocardiopsis sediminis]|uniref:Uncharacterized protein n=1 Tax=Nocardiopsis sediminis TaxID=1778267 RepID=A0ABV8FNI5_9ACTN
MDLLLGLIVIGVVIFAGITIINWAIDNDWLTTDRSGGGGAGYTGSSSDGGYGGDGGRRRRRRRMTTARPLMGAPGLLLSVVLLVLLTVRFGYGIRLPDVLGDVRYDWPGRRPGRWG